MGQSDSMTAAEYQTWLRSKTKAKKGKVVPIWKNLPTQPQTSASCTTTQERNRTSEFIFPGLLPGNNGPKGILRMSVSEKSQLKMWLVSHVIMAKKHRHTGPLRFELVRHSIGRLMDYDNLVSTGKFPTDVLQEAGVIPDDNPAIITERKYSQTKALNQKAQFTLIRIIDLPLP